MNDPSKNLNQRPGLISNTPIINNGPPSRPNPVQHSVNHGLGNVPNQTVQGNNLQQPGGFSGIPPAKSPVMSNQGISHATHPNHHVLLNPNNQTTIRQTPSNPPIQSIGTPDSHPYIPNPASN